MILTLVDIAECIAELNIADREHIYCGRMADKKACCIGIYNLSARRQRHNTVGGSENRSYQIKPVSMLIHWNKSTSDTEEASARIYEAVSSIRNVEVNGKRILFTEMQTDISVDVGTDDNGVYEMVIEADFYYER